jgi:hypothetical protein
MTYQYAVRPRPPLWFGAAIVAGLALCGCQGAPSVRLGTAQGIAASAGMAQRDIAAAPFLIRSYERIGDPGRANARVYIEGDGLAWLSANRPSPDPTPIDPVALSLARADRSANVIYLARPCQYTGLASGGVCPDRYWRGARFAPEVIAAMNGAIDDAKRRHGLRGIELVGYSGGAAIAVLAAARRGDVVSIVTVAGNLDNDAFIRLHQVSPMPASLNPADVAARIARIPQRHFVGGGDWIVPVGIYQSYRARAGQEARIGVTIVPEADHQHGWTERWRGLLGKV